MRHEQELESFSSSGTILNISAIAVLSVILISSALTLGGGNFVSSAMTGSGSLTDAAGYQVSGPTNSFSSMKGSWVVPKISCSSGSNTQSNISVVLDGMIGSSDGLYVGTFANCVSGKPSYGAYMYSYPSTSKHGGLKILSITINVGDKVSAIAKWVSSTQSWHAQVVDETTGCSGLPTCSVKSTGKSTGGAKLNTASFLVGMPSGASLTNYNSALLGSDYTAIKDTCSVAVAGLGKATTLGALSLTSSYTVSPITQRDAKKNTMATPSALSADGGSFTVTWVAAS